MAWVEVIGKKTQKNSHNLGTLLWSFFYIICFTRQIAHILYETGKNLIFFKRKINWISWMGERKTKKKYSVSSNEHKPREMIEWRGKSYEIYCYLVSGVCTNNTNGLLTHPIKKCCIAPLSSLVSMNFSILVCMLPNTTHCKKICWEWNSYPMTFFLKSANFIPGRIWFHVHM